MSITLTRFILASADDKPTEGTQRVRSEYVEDNWLPYIGPHALVLARLMDRWLAVAPTQGVVVKAWAHLTGMTEVDLVAALERLIRYGLAEWGAGADNTFVLVRHWPLVPPAILTKRHRDALTALEDLPA
jgi:hypothetical protein